MLPTRVEEEHTYGENSGQFGFGFSQCPQSQPGQWQEHVGQGVYQPHK